MILWLLDIRLCSSTAAFYYAHIGFPLANALMGASVWLVVFLTLSQYMAVCHPFRQGWLRKRRMSFILFAVAYLFSGIIHVPWAKKKYASRLPNGLLHCPHIICDRPRMEEWFRAYEWVREFLTRVLPFIFIAYFNAMILITYRRTKKDRIQRLATQSLHKRTAMDRSEQEEKRLFTLLFAIIIVFFLCTIPAAPLTIFVADKRSQNLSFQIFRAVTNLLEFTKFALNFYFYCLINPDIRRICLSVVRCDELGKPPRVKGQPVNPISVYTNYTKTTNSNNTVRRAGAGSNYCLPNPYYGNDSSRRSSGRYAGNNDSLRRPSMISQITSGLRTRVGSTNSQATLNTSIVRATRSNDSYSSGVVVRRLSSQVDKQPNSQSTLNDTSERAEEETLLLSNCSANANHHSRSTTVFEEIVEVVNTGQGEGNIEEGDEEDEGRNEEWEAKPLLLPTISITGDEGDAAYCDCDEETMLTSIEYIVKTL